MLSPILFLVTLFLFHVFLLLILFTFFILFLQALKLTLYFVDVTISFFIQPSGKYEMKKVKGKYTLKIKSSSVVDEGIYQFQIRGVRSEAELVCSGKLISK